MSYLKLSKINKHQLQSRREKEISKYKQYQLNQLQQRRIDLQKIDLSKHGWVSQLSKKWNLSHTQVKRWIKKNCSDISFYERKPLCGHSSIA